MRLCSCTICLTLFLFWGGKACCQAEDSTVRKYRVMFYNAENFFDPFSDSTEKDLEFTPEGTRRWTPRKYRDKRNKLYKLIVAAGQGTMPSIIGFAEVENRFVLEDLVRNTPMNRYRYRVVHKESLDERGIDVALVYLEDDFRMISNTAVRVTNPAEDGWNTRDILYVKGLMAKDTLHILVNHWPSRYGGLLETKPHRLAAADILRSVIDSICLARPRSAVLVMGDFNDNPSDESVRSLKEQSICPMLDVRGIPDHPEVSGTLKYKGNWEVFDQFLVSQSLGDGTAGLGVYGDAASIFAPRFLLTQDRRYLGLKPARTYEGFNYTGGFSDHLPIFMDIYTTEPQ